MATRRGHDAQALGQMITPSTHTVEPVAAQRTVRIARERSREVSDCRNAFVIQEIGGQRSREAGAQPVQDLPHEQVRRGVVQCDHGRRRGDLGVTDHIAGTCAFAGCFVTRPHFPCDSEVPKAGPKGPWKLSAHVCGEPLGLRVVVHIDAVAGLE